MPTRSLDPASADVYAAAYDELLRIARRERRKANASATVNTTALVHETWLKLRSHIETVDLDRTHFLAIAARAMRQVLIDHARRGIARKREHLSVTLDHADDGPDSTPAFDILELDTAMRRLEDLDARLARVVDLHVFSGMEFHEIATLEGIPERSLFRLWRNARVFLLAELSS